jgi:hypothetical protein
LFPVRLRLAQQQQQALLQQRWCITAPASDGGATITSYTATSTPDSVTGTLSQAGSGTITVTGLTGNTSYTFTVTATNSAGTSAASAASNSITTPLAIGQAFGGGFFAGQISTAATGVADYNLVIAPKSSGEDRLQWKTSDTSTAGTSSVIDGPTNSSNMNNASHPAAQFCEGLTIGSFSDWYMPAQNELDVCYFNLKPTTNSNDTSSGTNTNAVPSRVVTTRRGLLPRLLRLIFKPEIQKRFLRTSTFLVQRTAQLPPGTSFSVVAISSSAIRPITPMFVPFAG